MGYRQITDNLISAGRATSQLLWQIVKSNFDTHEDRTTNLENSNTVVPPGFIFNYGGDTVPTGFLLCDGTSVNEVDFPDLFAIIGTSYGSAGSGQFNLPDFRGRCVVGAGSGTLLTTRAVGDKSGEERHTLTSSEMPSHSHTVFDPGHRHGGVMNNAGPFGYFHVTDFKNPAVPTTASTSSTTGISLQNSGSGSSHNNMQPSVVVNFIIKT